MSYVQPVCEKCSSAMECARVAWFLVALRSNFAVSWSCPSCPNRTLVVSPLGPENIRSTGCVHCGFEHNSETAPCPSCGVSLDNVLSSREQQMSDDELLAMATDGFALGTCRRALSIANFVLRRNASCDEARSMRAQFVEHLDSVPAFS